MKKKLVFICVMVFSTLIFTNMYAQNDKNQFYFDNMPVKARVFDENGEEVKVSKIILEFNQDDKYELEENQLNDEFDDEQEMDTIVMSAEKINTIKNNEECDKLEIDNIYERFLENVHGSEVQFLKYSN